MTVAELIKQLQFEDPNKQVFIGYPFGDYCRTTAADEVTEVELKPVRKWAYNDGHCIAHEDSEEETFDAVVIQ